MLRREGFAGPLTLIGDEPGDPYDRPPLSKQVLTGQVAAEAPRCRPPGSTPSGCAGSPPPAWTWNAGGYASPTAPTSTSTGC